MRLIDGENFKRDPNASIPTPQPARYRRMSGAFGGARFANSMSRARPPSVAWPSACH
ncbi:MAG: hypothetical protein ACREVE_08175 [Gammaproteobacteria bacterium]